MNKSFEEQLADIRQKIDTRNIEDAQLDKQVEELEHMIRSRQRRKMIEQDKWHREMGESNE